MYISEIIKQWDINAEKRYEQIKSGKDISYNHIYPRIQHILTESNHSEIIINII